MYFAYDGTDCGAGITLHATAEEAKREAECSLDAIRDYAGEEGWDEDVESICWGKIEQVATACRERPATEGSPWDFIYDVELQAPPRSYLGEEI
jgi:hypothetical protein